MKMRPRYTEAEDKEIKNCPRGELAALAIRLGRPYGGINGRRQKLRGGDTTAPIHRGVKAPPKKAMASRFARPAWFDENVETISRAGR